SGGSFSMRIFKKLATRLAASDWVLPSRYATRLTRSAPLSPLEKSAHCPLLVFIENDPIELSDRFGLSGLYSSPSCLPFGNQCARIESMPLKARAAIILIFSGFMRPCQ